MTKVDFKAEARGRPCMVQIPGICCNDPETTVLAHLNVQGLNVKAHDIHGAWACHECHDWLDTGWTFHAVKNQRDLLHLQGVIRTQIELIKEGKLCEI